MSDLFDMSSYAPHGFCLMWRPWLIWLHAASDAVIALSYFVIPLAILRFLHLRPERSFGGLAGLFAAFILFCGATHLLGLATLWWPIYEAEGVLKGATAAASAATAAVVLPLAPKLARLPSPSALEAANAELRAEIARHETTLEELRAARADLERQVAARTAELQGAFDRLAVVALETAHRAKNQLTVVDAIARRSAASAPDKEALVEALSGRIESLAAALDAVRRGDGGAADLAAVAEAQLAHWRGFGERIAVEGSPVALGPEAAQQIGLVIHELATNAAKHGALSTETGRAHLSWRVSADALRLDWVETGGPVGAGQPRADGFGALLLDRAAPAQIDGEARREMTPEGLRYSLVAPLSSIAPGPGETGAEAEEAALARAFASES